MPAMKCLIKVKHGLGCECHDHPISHISRLCGLIRPSQAEGGMPRNDKSLIGHPTEPPVQPKVHKRPLVLSTAALPSGFCKKLQNKPTTMNFDMDPISSGDYGKLHRRSSIDKCFFITSWCLCQIEERERESVR